MTTYELPYHLHEQTRTIILSDDINDETGRLFLNAMHLLESSSDEPIHITLNSGGGCFYNGMAIFDAIKTSKCHVTIKVVGHAMSMGAVILQAADHRMATANSVIMLHDGDVTMAESIKPEDLSIYTKHDAEMRDRMHKIFADATGRSKSYFAKKLLHDWYLTAERAKKEKLIDEICE